MVKVSAEANCTFYDRQAGLVRTDISIPSGLGQRVVKLENACARHATTWACEMWTMPGPHRDETWYVCRLSTLATSIARSVFLKEFPTRDAAEMWMLHHGE